MRGSTRWGSTCLVAALLAAPAVVAEVYKYVDEDGVVHFTNVPNDKRYKQVGPGGKALKKKRKATRTRGRRPGGKLKRRVVDTYDEHIAEASQRFNIPGALVKAVIVVESNCNPKAVSHAGAQGLMQLMPKTAAEMGVEDPFDPRQNILGGTRYLRTLANSFDGDLVLTLASYNAGQKAVNRHMGIPPFDETQRYVRRVLQLYFAFKKQAGEDAESEPAGEGQ